MSRRHCSAVLCTASKRCRGRHLCPRIPLWWLLWPIRKECRSFATRAQEVSRHFAAEDSDGLEARPAHEQGAGHRRGRDGGRASQ